MILTKFDFFYSDVLALPIFKQEESSLPSDNENKILPFEYVLCASTSPAVKLHEETLTYLNQGWAAVVCFFKCFPFHDGCKYKEKTSWVFKKKCRENTSYCSKNPLLNDNNISE